MHFHDVKMVHRSATGIGLGEFPSYTDEDFRGIALGDLLGASRMRQRCVVNGRPSMVGTSAF